MISPGFVLPNDNPYVMKPQPRVESLFLKNASREFLYAWAAGVEMETKLEVTPDGRHIITMSTVPLVGIADMGDGRITVFTRPRPK